MFQETMEAGVIQREPARRKKFNLYRKIWHMLGLLLPLFFYLDLFSFLNHSILHATRFLGVVILLTALGCIVTMDLLRFRFSGINRLFIRFIGPLLKEEERGRFNGTAPYMIGNLFLFLFFSREVVILVSLFLMIGDPVAAYVGIFHGKRRFWNGKSLEGFLGFVGAAFAGGLLFLLLHSLFHSASNFFVLWGGAGVNLPLLALLLLGVLASATAEFFSGNYLMGLVDDNLIVPITGALTMALGALLMAGISPDQFFFNPLHLCDRNVLCAPFL